MKDNLKQRNKTKNLTYCALFTCLLMVSAQLGIPLPGTTVPINLATCAVLVAGAVLGPKYGLVSVLCYIGLGAVGLPVFSHFRGGLGVLTGPTGGYILGYVFCAYITGFFTNHFKNRKIFSIIGMVFGLTLCYLFGTLWYMFLTHIRLWQALMLCVVPFIIGDCLKIILAIFLSGRLKKILRINL